MYIWFCTLNYSLFFTENLDFFDIFLLIFLMSFSPWQFLTRCKKKHIILINTECMRGPRVQTLLGHLFNRDSRTGKFQPYMAWKRNYTINLQIKFRSSCVLISTFKKLNHIHTFAINDNEIRLAIFKILLKQYLSPLLYTILFVLFS